MSTLKSFKEADSRAELLGHEIWNDIIHYLQRLNYYTMDLEKIQDKFSCEVEKAFKKLRLLECY